MEKDVLGSLIPKLSQRGVKTYAAFEGLFDPYAASINPNWVEVDWQGDSLFNTISPCIEEYRYYLRDIISEVAQQYPVAGILLRDITFYSLASGFNQVDISTFEEETGKKIEDEVNFETRTIGADFQKWKQTVEDSYLIFLNQQVHAIRSDIEFIYAHMPIPCGWDPLWSNIYRTDTFSTGYWHLPQRIANISKTVDRVMLVYCSNFWLNPIKSQLYRDLFDVPDGAYSAFDLFRMHLKDTVDGITSVNGKLMVSIQITDEWPFSPEFYNVTNRLFKSFSVDWICYYNPAASIGDEGSSASPFLWETIDKIAVALVTPTSATVSPSSSSSSPDPTGGLLEFISQETVYPIIIAGILMITVAITILAIKRRRR